MQEDNPLRWFTVTRKHKAIHYDYRQQIARDLWWDEHFDDIASHWQEFQKALGSKHSVYDTTTRTGRALKDKTTLQDDNQKLDDMLSELRDRWDTVCGKSVER